MVLHLWKEVGLVTSPKTRDASTRAREREGGLPLHVILREGHDVLPGYTSARDLPIPDSERQWPHTRDCECLECQPAPAYPLGTVRLLALLGHEEARELVTPIGGRPWGWWDDRLLIYPQDWAGKLTRLADKLPPHDLGVPARRWLLVVAAHAAAVGCHRFLFHERGWRGPQVTLARYALDACAAWIEEPTPEREHDCAVQLERLRGARVSAQYVSQPFSPLLAAVEGVDKTAISVSLLAASKLLGPERLRAVVAEALIPRLLPS